ncbi:hypothetical protein OSB04_028264 [Centaurea solstitialis]|uniref:Uncharacterized protein n=1 Tax=Centaurea solstitialis TaxID=347529 RepID=A0AA38SMT2_9ASTR|nr:hypothetical protein OSB04_028264 [Centaurea solstitialis]
MPPISSCGLKAVGFLRIPRIDLTRESLWISILTGRDTRCDPQVSYNIGCEITVLPPVTDFITREAAILGPSFVRLNLLALALAFTILTNLGCILDDPLDHLALVECLSGIVSFCACLRLEHVPQLADHVISIRIYEPRLQIWTHSCKHKTTNIQQIIGMLLMSVPDSSRCICWRGLS